MCIKHINYKKNKMKVLHLITSLNRGGAENHLTCLIRGQLKENKEIFVLYLKGDGYWVNYLKSIGVKVSILNNFNIISQIKEIKNTIKKEKIDILHSHLPHMELLGYMSLLGNSDTKFIITKHVDNDYLGGSNIKKRSIISSIISLIIYSRVNSFIAISNSVKKFLIENSYVDKTKIKLIYYGLDNFYIQRCLEDKKKIIINDNSKITFGFIGRLVKQKQVDKIIKSFKKYKEESNIDSKFLIVGSGPEKNKLIELSKTLKIEKEIIWLDFSDNVGGILKHIDVFCINSSFEGLGLVMLEAMAYSKPLIGPNVSAIPEVIKNNENGLLVKPNDVNEYKDAMIKMSNDKLRKDLSNRSVFILQKNFNFEKMVNKVSEVYNYN